MMKAERRLRASFTIEAAVVMPVLLCSLVFLMTGGFKLHDIVLGNLTANEAAELYGHLPQFDGDAGDMEGSDPGRIEQYGNTRLQSVLSDIRYSLSIEPYRDGSKVKLQFEGGEREYVDAGSRPEKVMRALTLIEAIVKEE